jgi:CDP-glucose 4,6-dehydratase
VASVEVLKNQVVLVTGASGFVGSHLVDDLAPDNTVVAVVRSIDPNSFFAKEELQKRSVVVRCDIQNTATIRHYLQKYAVTHVFHLAAQPYVQSALKDPAYTYKTNIMGTVSVLEACRQAPSVQSIVVVTTDKVYGELTSDAYRETDAFRPTQPYDVSKACADLICQSYAQTFNMPIAIVRAGNIYGEGDVAMDRIIPAIMKAAVTSETLQLRSNGQNLRNYIYVKDVTNAYALVGAKIHRTRGEAFNIGSDQEWSVIDLITQISGALGKKIPYTVENSAQFELQQQALDSAKVTSLLGWKPRHTLAQVAKQIYTYYQSVL